MYVSGGKFLFHSTYNFNLFFKRWINEFKSGPGREPSANFGVMIHEAGNAPHNSIFSGLFGDARKIGQIILQRAHPCFKKTKRIKTPVYRVGAKSLTQVFKLVKPLP
jgi:hypothetical protein